MTESEAAEYCGLSLNSFLKYGPKMGIVAFPFADTVIYRADDMDAAMERAWRRNIGEKTETHGICNIPREAYRNGPRLVTLPEPKRKRRGSQ